MPVPEPGLHKADQLGRSTVLRKQLAQVDETRWATVAERLAVQNIVERVVVEAVRFTLKPKVMVTPDPQFEKRVGELRVAVA